MIEVRVNRISYEAVGINSFELVPVRGNSLPPFTAGAHIEVQVPGGFSRQYSLLNSPTETHRYVIAVLHSPQGRGGSDAMRKTVGAGDVVLISEPRNNFAMAEDGARYVLVAGGIGITPLMAMVARLTQLGVDFTLHYCSRSIEATAFYRDLAPMVATGRVHFYHDNGVPANGLDVKKLLEHRQPSTYLYCCGPTGLMASVRAATMHWPSGTVRFESFAVPELAERAMEPSAGAEFEVQLASTGERIGVSSRETILEALRAHAIEVDSSCEAGTCGTCKTRYLEGTPDHQDFVLTEDEQKEFIMVCVSRSKSPRLILDL